MTIGDATIRLAAAGLMGGAVGMERELSEKNAGLRTHILVALGAALFTVVSMEFATGGATADPSRIASQVVTGIGFLGAGAILKQGLTVSGLTTAATLWVTASIGMAAAFGMFAVSGIATAFSLIALVVLGRTPIHVALHRRTVPATLSADYRPGGLNALLADLRSRECEVSGVSLGGSPKAGKPEQATVSLRMPRQLDPEQLLKSLRASAGVHSVRLDVEALPPPG